MDFEERNTLYNIRKTVLEMLKDRNYIVPSSENITFDEFSIKFKNKNIDIYVDNTNENKGKAYVYFHNENKTIPKADLKNLLNKTIETYQDEDIKLIIILKEKGNGSIFKEITKDIYKNVEIFMNKNMIINITHHEFVPKHMMLTENEENEVLDKYSTTKNKLPKILKNDPIAKYYGMKPNQICKIIRKSPEVGDYIYYRLVK
jgi:DNA-directed RNA polymerases I, II, and III subunit RPABC1